MTRLSKKTLPDDLGDRGAFVNFGTTSSEHCLDKEDKKKLLKALDSIGGLFVPNRTNRLFKTICDADTKTFGKKGDFDYIDKRKAARNVLIKFRQAACEKRFEEIRKDLKIRRPDGVSDNPPPQVKKSSAITTTPKGKTPGTAKKAPVKNKVKFSQQTDSATDSSNNNNKSSSSNNNSNSNNMAESGTVDDAPDDSSKCQSRCCITQTHHRF